MLPPPGKGLKLEAKDFQIPLLLMFLNVAVFLWMQSKAADVSIAAPLDLVQWGGSYSPKIAQGEWWRVFTSIFVHAGWLHLIFNMIYLLLTGALATALMGTTACLIIYLAGGMVGQTLGLYLHPYMVSVGASGAIFAILGAVIAYLVAQGRGVRASKYPGLLLALFRVLPSGSGPGVDLVAHIGGLFAGVLLGAIYAFEQKRESSSFFRTASFASLAICAFFIHKLPQRPDLIQLQAELKDVQSQISKSETAIKDRLKEKVAIQDKRALSHQIQQELLTPMNLVIKKLDSVDFSGSQSADRAISEKFERDRKAASGLIANWTLISDFLEQEQSITDRTQEANQDPQKAYELADLIIGKGLTDLSSHKDITPEMQSVFEKYRVQLVQEAVNFETIAMDRMAYRDILEFEKLRSNSHNSEDLSNLALKYVNEDFEHHFAAAEERVTNFSKALPDNDRSKLQAQLSSYRGARLLAGTLVLDSLAQLRLARLFSEAKKHRKLPLPLALAKNISPLLAAYPLGDDPSRAPASEKGNTPSSQISELIKTARSNRMRILANIGDALRSRNSKQLAEAAAQWNMESQTGAIRVIGATYAKYLTAAKASRQN